MGGKRRDFAVGVQFICFLLVCVATVKSDPVIPIFDKPPGILQIPENTPVNTCLGQLSLKGGQNLQIKSSNDVVKVEELENKNELLTVKIVLIQTPLDYDSGPHEYLLIFSGSNSDYQGILYKKTLYITDVNDEYPGLKNLPYNFDVAENQSPGIVVFNKIRASDPDQHDELEYSLTTNAQGADDDYKNKFTIDSKTGDLTLKYSLDYETNRFYQYTVTVKDKVGHNTTADIFITVTDVQDEPPSFTRESYKASIEEGKNIGTSVLTVKARDGDRGVPNSMIYTINSETCPGLFQLSSSTGELTVKKEADRDSGHPKQQNGICKLEIKAEEGTEHKQAKQGANTMAVVDVSITIEDVNDNRPMFSKGSFSGTVDENTQIGVPITLSTPISVEDKDQGKNAEFTVTLTNHQESFEVSPSLVQSSGNLMIRVKNSTILDYELQESLKIMLEAKETGTDGKTDTAVVNLTIKNVNDNSPQFSNFVSSANVTENANVDANVMTVKATDKDKNDDGNNFGTVEYSFVENDPFFKINKKTGLVQVANKGLDRETKDIYYLTVVAEDGGHIKETTQISISITDENDNGPQFVTDDYQTSLAEQDKDFSRPVKVLATDMDQRDNPNSEIVYSIKSSTPTGLDKNFLINSTDGRISVASPLTYENIKFPPHQEGKIILTVMAKDRGTAPMNSTVNVVISLQDVNNNAPKCEKPVYKTSVAENKAKSHFVKVGATDSDATAPNNRIMYTIDQISADKFVMNSSSGELSTRVALDRENLKSYNITVTVTDFGVPSKSGTCHVSVSVTDVNDESPVFQKKSISKSYPENTPGLVITNTAVDEDTDPELSYKIDWSKSTGINHLDQTVTNVSQSYFKIDSTTGNISLIQKLDRETIRLFTLHMIVEDVNSANGNQMDTATVTVTVQDQNDEPPSFIDGNIYEAEILENMPPGSEINIKNKSLSVEDKDEGVNSEFSLTLATYSADFSLTPSVGTGRETFTISVKNQAFLDYETLEKFTIKIKAVDKHNPKLSNTATVTVRIINKNDNIPEFDGAPFTASVPEGNKNACFTTIKAHDDDKAPYGAVLFSLPQKPPQFTINETSGFVCTNEALDREKQDSFSVSVKVRDSENFSSTTQLIVTVDDINDNGPVFVNKKIQTDIDEGQPNFTPALNVQAKDNDKPGTNNSKIVYTLKPTPGLQSNFTINRDTGQITLQSPLDYESLNQNHRKMITLVVEAKDQGKPSKSSTASVTVNVKDINDVKPTFPKDNYTIHISENASNTEIIHLVAKDKDATSPNNIVSYSMDTLSASTFEIEPTNGMISLKTQLDREKNPAYKITVTAMDQGTPSLTATTVVHLVVDDVNDEKPSFSKGPNPVEPVENVMFQYNCSATDPDENYNLQYQILWSESSGQDGVGKSVNSMELQKWIQINSTTCQLKSRKKLDREEVAMFSLVIEVKDLNAQPNKPQTDKVTLIINVKDENDAEPEFGEVFYVADIPENMPDGTEIPFKTAITVQDKDEGKNSELKVELDSLEEFFSVSPKTVTGSERLTIKVTNSSLLDFEKNETITLKIVATETQTQEKYSSNATITINIINKNDNMPEFVGAPFYGAVLENKQNGTLITTVKAEDKDSGTLGKVFFSLPENPIEFTINQTSGEVFTAKRMNREEKSSYTIIVRVQDGGNFYSTTQLTVTILDENDETPDFRNKIFATEIEENKPTFIPPFVVQAKDNDKPGTNNSKIVYTLKPTPGLQSNFTINRDTGQITLQSPLDYESLNQNQRKGITLVVEAKDQGKPPRSSTVSLTVNVKDINDVKPTFPKDNYNIHISENASLNTEIIHLVAKDKDATSPNNIVSYSMDTLSASTFEIEPTNGMISLKTQLDREKNLAYNITVTAMDQGTPSLTATTVVRLVVDDVNDEKPSFSKGPNPVEQVENVMFQYNCSATDPDENYNLQYQILWSESSGQDGVGKSVNSMELQKWIQINSTTCQLKSRKKLDREEVAMFSLVIEVKDLNAQPNKPQTDKVTLIINVKDENDAEPEFGEVFYVADIPENMPDGTEIPFKTAITVQDKDEGKNSQLKVKLDSLEEFFSVSPKTVTGSERLTIKVTNSSLLDFEKNETITLKIVATETQTQEKYSSNATITINIINKNDNMPEFVGAPFYGAVLENKQNGTLITTVKAEDKDSGTFGNVFFSLPENPIEFTINQTSGEVFTAKQMNREEKSSYTIIVRVQDGGNFYSTTQLTVTILDENDETPDFRNKIFATEIEENKPKFIPPFVVQAFDGDAPDTKNSEIVYSLKQPPTGLHSNFSINDTTGEITLNSVLDYEALDSYLNGVIVFVIQAKDQGKNQSNSASVSVTISVTDTNDNQPIFQQVDYQKDVLENIKSGISIAKVLAEDKDGTAPNNEVFYVIQSGGQDKFQINSTSGEIAVGVGSELDRETIESFSLTVLAIDKGIPALTSTTTVGITVKDVNDTPPKITSTVFSTKILENSTKTSEVMNITATDEDEDSLLEYSILWIESRAFDERDRDVDVLKIKNWMAINSTTGTITVNSTLDRELVEQVVMKIQVKDVRAEMNTTQVATGTVTVSILDVNDNPPVISSVSSVLNLSVSEGTKVDTEVTTLSATDKDKEQDVQFHLAGSTSFNITETGKLILTKQLDRENSSTQEFTVIATDNGRPPQSSNISVKVEILDINDNDPEFIQNLKRFKVLENSNNQTIVANMSAKDKDSGHNANITFQFMDVSPFRIDAITGSIYVDGELDREKTSSYTLTVIAADNPLLEERRRASTVISIDVEDINDNPPEFPTSVMTDGYFGRLSETSKNTTVVSLKPAAISATDRDEGQNAKITFSFKNASNDYFKIDPQSGIVTVNKDNLKNMVDEYRYVVIASDQGTVPKTTEVNITIDVLDENINDPKFVDQGPIPSIPECTITGWSVYTFKATDNDKDKSTNGRVQYFLDNSTTVDDWKYFKLHPDTGDLTLAKPLDSEDSSDLLIRVIARDMGEPPNQTPVREMKVKVTDVNDNPPHFKEGQKTDFSVKEGLDQTVIGKIIAIDPDENATLKYEITDLASEWKDFFTIETGSDKSGTIYLTKSLDHEEINFIKFKVNAKDDFIANVDEACGGTFQDAKSHTATPLEVSIKVEDVDDSPPVFSDDTISRGFLSGTEFGKTIIRLTDYVTDNDTAPFSVHGFYQVGELKADQQLQKGWSPTITATPLKVNVNGSVVTNYKFSGDVFGAFTLKVLANDTAGNDTVNLKIYVVGDAQVVKMTFYYTEEQLRLLQEEIGRELSKLGYEVIPDNIQPYYKDDGTVDGSKSVLLLHAVDHTTGDIISGNQLLNELDSASNLISEILQRYKVLNTQLGTAARKSSANKDDTRTRYILISIIVIIAITFVITLYFLIHNIRRFKRKLKAATLEVHALDPIKQDMVPGLDDRIREANPIYMRDDLALDDGKYGIDGDSYDSLSLKSENSLDKNAIDSVQPARNMEPATDEQEMTLDMYGNDDPLAVNDLRPRGMNFLNQAFERHGEKYDDIDKKERDGRAENDDQSDEEDILNVDLSQFESTEI